MTELRRGRGYVIVGRACWGKSELEDRHDERREQTFIFFFLFFPSFPLVRLLFRSLQFLTFVLQLRSPAGASLDRHHYKISKYSAEERWHVWRNANCKLSFTLCSSPSFVVDLLLSSSPHHSFAFQFIFLLTLFSLISSLLYDHCPTG